MEHKDKYNVASELIEKGYLIHCTDAVFSQFDEKFIKGGFRAREGYGFYFSDMPYKSIEYGNEMILIKKDDFNFLNLEDKINMDWFSNDAIKYEIARLEYLLDNCRNSREYDLYTTAIDSMKEKIGEFDEDLWLYVREAVKEGAENYGQLEYYINNPQVNVPKLIKVYLNNGYDGGYYDGIYTVFNVNKLNEKFIKYNVMSESAIMLKYIIKETIDDYLRHNLLK